MRLVESRFSSHFGRLRPFHWPTDRTQALQAWTTSSATLPRFGEEQDAMLADDRGCRIPAVVLAEPWPSGLAGGLRAGGGGMARGRVPIAAAEGFIRQIIGWREFIGGLFPERVPTTRRAMRWAMTGPLPAMYWVARRRWPA